MKKSCDLHRQQHQTKPQLAAALIEQMEASAVAPDVYTVDSALFAPVGPELGKLSLGAI